MSNTVRFLDKLGGPWQLMKILSIFIVIGLIVSHSFDIYALYSELIYIPEDFITLSWEGVNNPDFSFYLVEIEDTTLASHGYYKRGMTLYFSRKTGETSVQIPMHDNHSYMFWVRAVYKDGSVSEALMHDTLFICQLPEGYVSNLAVEDLEKQNGNKLSLQESIDIFNSEAIRPCVGDLNNDNMEDLIIGKKDGSIDFYKRIHVNGGKKLDFEYPQFILSDNQVLDVGDNASPFVIDYNRDGLKDLLVGCRDGKVILFTNIGDANTLQFDSGKILKSSVDDPGLGMYVTVCATDWNNDGKFDMLTGNDEGYVNLYINTGDDTSPEFGTYEPVMISGEEMILGAYTQPLIYDWNGDGRKDLLVSDSSGATFLFQNRGKDSEPLLNDMKTVMEVDGIPTISISNTGDSFKVLIGSQDNYINFYN